MTQTRVTFEGLLFSVNFVVLLMYYLHFTYQMVLRVAFEDKVFSENVSLNAPVPSSERTGIKVCRSGDVYDVM